MCFDWRIEGSPSGPAPPVFQAYYWLKHHARCCYVAATCLGMSSQKTQDNYNYVFDIIIKQKNTNVTVHVSMNVNETHYLGHQVDKATSTNNEATADQLRKVSHSPSHRRRRRRRRSRLLDQRRTQQDHWRSTHDTEDNITTGRDVPRTDGSAVPLCVCLCMGFCDWLIWQQRSSQVTTAFMTDQETRPDSSHLARRPGTTSKDWHFHRRARASQSHILSRL